MSSVVTLTNVTKRFGDQTAVDNVSFTVAAGSFFSLLGPSGCGKSTTLRLLSGFEYPDSGELKIDGADISAVPPYRRPTNMVFQRWALFPHMTVHNNVAFGLEVERVNSRERNLRVGEMLDLVGLSEYAQRKPDQLSGGQMQRVALARALVKHPKVLLLDEPLGALDLKLRTQMQLELKRLQQEIGTTFIYVTHDQGEAMTMSDSIAVMNNGRIEQIASPEDIYDAPQTRFVADFIGGTNLVPVEIEPTPNEAGLVSVRVGELTFPAEPVGPLGASGYGHVSLRYERVIAGPDAIGLATSTKARVREVVFQGSSVVYVVALQCAPVELTVQVAKSGKLTLPVTGDEIAVGWAEDAARLFPETSASAAQ